MLARRNIVHPTDGDSDPYWASVVLLIQPDEDDTSIIDLSNSGHTITNNGVTLGTSIADPFGGSRKVLYFSTDYLSIDDSSDWHYANGDFTIEIWCHFDAGSLGSNATRTLISQYVSDTAFWVLRVRNFQDWGWSFQDKNSSNIVLLQQGSDFTTTEQWLYVAVVRDGNDFDIRVDGSSVASDTDTDSLTDHSADLRIGKLSFDYFKGTIYSVRITKGVARDVSSVPSAPWPTS